MYLENRQNKGLMLEKRGQCRPVPNPNHMRQRKYAPSTGSCLRKDLEISTTPSCHKMKSMNVKKKMVVKVMKMMTDWILPWVHNYLVSRVMHQSLWGGGNPGETGTVPSGSFQARREAKQENTPSQEKTVEKTGHSPLKQRVLAFWFSGLV